MRLGLLALIFAILPLTACIQLMDPEEGMGGGAGAGGTGGGDAPDQSFDGTGVCRSSLSVESSGCALDFAAARALMPRCGWGCSGPCGERLVYLDNCEPSRACAYDPVTYELLAATIEATSQVFCQGRSETLTFGDEEVSCEFSSFDPLVECSGSG